MLSSCLRHAGSFLLATGFLLTTASVVSAQPLHVRIDQAIAARPEFARSAAPTATDEEFLRRVTLDLTGTIPTADEARSFLADNSPDRRGRLIDRLLASPEHVRHLQNVFDVLLMERRADKNVPRPQWQEYLRTSIAANKPWDKLVAEIVAADGSNPQTRPAAKFFLDRDADPNVLTRDVGRLFLGMNLTCAQCHDHPLINDYKQDWYYGVFAFFNRTYLFTDPARVVMLAEKAEGDTTFQSVFDPAKVTKTTLPRLPGGAPVAEQKADKGKEYKVAAGKGVRPVPAYSRREQLAAQLASAGNVAFKRNIANRLWALLMGRGLVHPVEVDHSENPPSHPELLTLLADEFAAMKFDVRAFLRELALSQTYQRSSETPAGVKDVDPKLFAVAHLKPLSPEQLAWALMQATGLTDAERKALGARANEAALHARLAASGGPLIATFAGQPGLAETTGFEASLEQTLFVANGATVRGWLAPRPGNLTDRLSKLTDADAVAEELYLSVLTRRPSAEERREVAEFLKGRDADRLSALQDVAWALLASVEFRFNH